MTKLNMTITIRNILSLSKDDFIKYMSMNSKRDELLRLLASLRRSNTTYMVHVNDTKEMLSYHIYKEVHKSHFLTVKTISKISLYLIAMIRLHEFSSVASKVGKNAKEGVKEVVSATKGMEHSASELFKFPIPKVSKMITENKTIKQLYEVPLKLGGALAFLSFGFEVVRVRSPLLHI